MQILTDTTAAAGAASDAGAAPDTAVAVLDPAAAQTLVSRPPEGIERPMLAQDKLPVVLAVVLLVWAGVLLLLARTERRLGRIERALGEHDPGSPGTGAAPR